MKKIIIIIITLLSVKAWGQDPQFSQYYNAPLILNPAMAGGAECYRAGVNARSQWAGLDKSFKTASVYADLNYPDLRSGFGIMFLHDNIGVSNLSSNEISGFYSYLVPFSEMLNIRLGLQGTYVSRSINYSKLIFEDQFSGTDVTQGKTTDPVIEYTRTQYLDLSTGFVLFGEDSYWLGFAAHHVNRPDQSFYGPESRLPIKLSVHGGYNFYYKTRHKQRIEEALNIVPTFLYKAESKFDQLDLGVYLIKAPLLLGAWYRGIFPKEDEGIRNNDAIILQAGVQFQNLSFTYRYDVTTSNIGIKNTLGSHEISLTYLFCLDWPPRKKPGRKSRRLPCPDFQRSVR